jgi:hypothetical protein
MMVVIIRTKKIIIPIKAFKAMKRVYLILIALHIGQAPNGPRFSRREASAAERRRLKAHVSPLCFPSRDETFVLIMATNPEPRYRITLKNTQSTIAACNPYGPNILFTIDALEMQG